MEKIKVLSIFGTRPEAIKMAPLVKKLEENENIRSMVAITAQHRQMLDQALETFDIKPDFDLDLMKHRQTISYITSSVLIDIGAILEDIKPDIVLVHGDTTTTFAAALAAFYAKCKVGHVEAGLRSFDKYQPYPEEMNRLLTSSLADIHFAPTSLSKQNLINESICEDKIFVTGNTAIDAMKRTVSSDYIFGEDRLNNLDFGKRIITMTAHRRENLGRPLLDICAAVNEITDKYKDVEFVYAVHKNPAVSEPVQAALGGNKQVHLVDPLNIDDMHNLINKSYMVLTDSGGLQEEAPSLHKPVVVLRNVTERPEGLDAGTMLLAGCEKESVVKSVCSLLDDEKLYAKMTAVKNPYGDGFASERIVDALLYYFGKTNEKPQQYLM